MSERLTAADLRALADALDAFAETTTFTGVSITGHAGQYVTVRGFSLQLHWNEGADVGQQYTLEVEST
jgi:hypothetical protein